ncbi:hypothetical protein [Solibacillus sp. CAU 1738]|uniref:hypothetical protein n=1 Tax=Solibacillus sp. CAU 1738 TaxID=3140363 RepID=UPI003261BA5D
MKRIRGKKYLKLTLLILLLFALSACTPNPKFELYKGNPLSIAVIGESPEVNEEQVKFTKVLFDEMTNENLKFYDAVFISEDNLFEAAESKYANIYLNSSIPLFFMGTESFIPFTVENMEYGNDWNWRPGSSYAVGIVISPVDDSMSSWGFGLYNDEKTDENIKNIYSRIFEIIEGLNH